MHNEILQQVRKLQSQLRPIDEESLRQAMYYPELDGWTFCDYETHAGYDACFMDAIGEWQVLRTVSVSTCVSFDGEDVDDWDEYQRCIEKFDSDGDDAHEFDYNCTYEGDFQQIWINVRTGLVLEFKRPRVRRHGPPAEYYYYDIEQDWCPPVTYADTTALYPVGSYCVPAVNCSPKCKDLDTLADYLVEGNVHSVLRDMGYDPSWGEDMERRSAGEYSIMEHGIVPFIIDLIHNANHVRDILMLGGVELFYRTREEGGHVTASRIATRHKYVVPAEERARYVAYLDNLIELGKDIHNPFYVCPKDLQHAYEHTKRIVERRRQERAREQQRLRELSEAEAIQAYAERMAQYARMHLDYRDGIQVMVCPTYQDMYEEGEAMHHCVGRNGYHKKLDSIIMFVRDANGGRISTIEYSISRGKVLQNRGLSNTVPPYFEDINALVESHAKEWRNPELIKAPAKTKSSTSTLQINVA